MGQQSYILNLSCPDTVGIVAAVAGFLAEQRCFIEESSHFGDAGTQHFFMRTQFTAPDDLELATFKQRFSELAQAFSMHWDCFRSADRVRAIVMASKQDHCIHDLLYRVEAGLLNMDIVAVVSNHREVESLCQWHRVPFHYVPVLPEKKSDAEAELSQLFDSTSAELIILARYMQILSADFCRAHPGQIINIHHSFLPGFKGAQPYHRAYERGVKLIGATAHYVTADLDEGPIIEQQVERVSHANSVKQLVAIGQDVEKLTLYQAVRYHVQRRVLLNGSKTVVFR